MVIRNRGGWTLIEIMIVCAIVGTIATLAPSVITQTTKFFILSRTKLELQEQARATMAILTRQLRQAQSGTITIDRVGGQPHYSRITFTRVGGGRATFYQSGTSLVMKLGNDTSILSKNLAYMAFTFPRSDDMTIVSVSLTLQEQIYNGAFKALHMASERVRVMN